MCSRSRRALALFLALCLLGSALALSVSPGARGQQPPSPTPSMLFGFGQPASAAFIQSENIDVSPDGTGLPAGSGTVDQGQMLYSQKCASCHGDMGQGNGAALPLIDTRAYVPGVVPATVGNYWPYATTIYDYIKRAMPFNAPGSLTPDEVYSLVAYLLNANGVIPADAVMNAQTLPEVVMPNVNGFTAPDPRPDVP